MPKDKHLFDASKPNLEDFYEDLYSHLPAEIFQKFVATIAIQRSIFELQVISDKYPEMGKVIKMYAIRPLIQKDFGERALTIYDRLIQQDGYKDLSLSRYYQICKKLKEEAEQLRKFINSDDMKSFTALPDWPVQAADQLNDLNNFFDKKINEHYQVLITYLARPGLQIYGRTPLIWAAYNGNFAIVKALLDQPGIDVNKADNCGNTSLIWAACRGHLETIKVLLNKAGIDVNKTDNNGKTPLACAAWHGHLETVKELLTQPGININKADNAYSTPLKCAAYNGHFEIVKMLLAQPGIDVNKADNDGNTPLDWAIRLRYLETDKAGYLKTVEMLLAQPGIDVNKTDNGDVTPLFRAILNKDLEIVKMLLAQPNIDVNITGSYDRTPLSLAESRGYEEIALLIKNHIASKSNGAAATPVPKKNQYLFRATKPKLESFYKDIYSNLPANILQEFVATLAAQHSIFELQLLSEKDAEMGKMIKMYAMRPLIQNDFGKRALTVYDNLIQQDNHKDLSLSKFYQICKKLKDEVEQLRGFINSEQMNFATIFADWPEQAAAELIDLNNFFDKTIKEHYQALIAYLARPELQDLFGKTPLIWAAYKGHCATVKALLAEPGIDVNKADNGGHTPLAWAAYHGHHEIVKVLLAQPGIDVNKVDNDGNTPLSRAAFKGYFEIVEMLLAQPDIDVNKAEYRGRTPLSFAKFHGHKKIELLIENHIASKSNAATTVLAAPGYAALHNQTTVNNGAVNTSNSNNFSMT